MVDALLEFLRSLPSPLAVMAAAMLPVIELRGALPFGRSVLGMSTAEAYLWSVLGNLIPVPFILWLLGPVTAWAESHWGWLHRFLERLFAHTRRRHSERFERLRDLALITFVAIPLPITGAWSGSLAAFVFGIRRSRALVLISVGVAIAGVIVGLLAEAGSALVGTGE